MLQGVVGSTAGGFAGVSAFAAACGLGIRALPAFGVWTVAPRWLLIAAGMGAAGYALIFIIQLVHAAPFRIRNPRDIKDEAARGGVLPFFLSLLGGAGFTPFGEDILFRGMVANALNQYGAYWHRRQLRNLPACARRKHDPARRGGLARRYLVPPHRLVVVLHCVSNASNSVTSVLHIGPAR